MLGYAIAISPTLPAPALEDDPFPAVMGSKLWSRGDDSNVVKDGANVESVPNRGTLGGLLKQLVLTSQPTFNATVLDFDGGDILIPTFAVAGLQFAHDGTGMTCGFVYKHDNTSTFQRTNATMNSATAGINFGLATTGLDGRSKVVFRVANASAQNVVDISHDYGVDPIGIWHTLIGTYSTIAGSELWADGVSVDSAAEAFTPSATDPTNNFGWGGVTGGTFRGVMPEVVLSSRVITDAEVAKLHTYLMRWSTP